MTKKIVIVYRNESKNALKTAISLARRLVKKGHKVFSHPKQTISPAIKKISSALFNKVDLVVVLGGDGTYLEAVRMLNGATTPILGVNMGSLGFLTPTRVKDLNEAVQMSIDGKMDKRARALIDLKVKRSGKVIKRANALNDVVVERGPYSQLINITIYSDKYEVGSVKADGIVIASPTGSTAYNLAAGGPILHPYAKAMVVTPICPHSLTHRPIIFPDDQTLKFKILNKKQKAFLRVDGQNEGELRPGDELIISRAKCDHFILRKPSSNYFELLREKLRFGERS